jgi:hypothetical protein
MFYSIEWGRGGLSQGDLQQFVGARANAFAARGRHFGWMAPGRSRGY